ncbi:MAG: lysostaphin resistance A-like protein [Phycisphaerae bacterium]
MSDEAGTTGRDDAGAARPVSGDRPVSGVGAVSGDAAAVGFDVPVARPVLGEGHVGVVRQRRAFLLLDSTRRAAWWDIVAVLVLLVGLSVVGGMALGVAIGMPPDAAWTDADDGDPLEREFERALLAPTLVAQATGAMLAVGLVLVYRRQAPASVGLYWRSLPLNVLLGIAATGVAYGLIFPIMAALLAAFPAAGRQMAENAGRLMAIMPDLSRWQYGGIALVVGMWEEVLFRGFLLTRLRRATGSWPIAVVLCTVVFTAPHALDQEPAALVMVSVLSLVFCVVTVWRRSIIPAIVGHALFDLSQFLYLAYARSGGGGA